jgi:uncharacterized membrane protein
MASSPLVAIVGVVLLVLGVALVAAPRAWERALATAHRPTLQAIGGGVRVLLGLALLYGARSSAYPTGVSAFGALLVAVGFVILWIDAARFSRWVDGWLAGSLRWRLRAGGGLMIVMGAILWAAAGT